MICRYASLREQMDSKKICLSWIHCAEKKQCKLRYDWKDSYIVSTHNHFKTGEERKKYLLVIADGKYFREVHDCRMSTEDCKWSRNIFYVSKICNIYDIKHVLHRMAILGQWNILETSVVGSWDYEITQVKKLQSIINTIKNINKWED